ncbi:signal recognition particle receptor beta subunit-domain-containing protein [Russula earlei]|uniref:Signal recognition particle receptor beta subunit-domain-containing protein n=1 Tax=Russula earlei TaxID=71964 RepID=A0ACC0UCH4_9AGAM|nr:signal recognition particle receptor beta subunit-domain-containing protein [Russula earlei]
MERLHSRLLVISLLVAILVLFALYLVRRRSRSRGNCVVFVGTSDAGKTAVLSTLVYGQTLPSHTSLQTNSGVFTLDKKAITLVDVPGHPRIREQFREYLPDAKAIVFVVDASNISRNGPVVAEHLHRVLHAVATIPPSKPSPAILLLAHKCDQLKTGSISAISSLEQLAINRVRSVLERELEKRRRSHTGSIAVDKLGAEGEDNSEMGGLDCTGPPGEEIQIHGMGGRGD